MAKRRLRKRDGHVRAVRPSARLRLSDWRPVPIAAAQLAPGPWFVVAVAPRSERRFVGRDDGCACDLPRTVLVPEIVRDVVVRGRRREQRLPRYPGYVLTVDVERLRRHDDVRGVLGESEGRSARALPNGAISALIALQGLGVIDMPPRHGVRVGERVSIGSGPFAGWLATVRRVVGDRRCEGLINLFGRKTSVEFDLDAA